MAAMAALGRRLRALGRAVGWRGVQVGGRGAVGGGNGGLGGRGGFGGQGRVLRGAKEGFGGRGGCVLRGDGGGEGGVLRGDGGTSREKGGDFAMGGLQGGNWGRWRGNFFWGGACSGVGVTPCCPPSPSFPFPGSAPPNPAPPPTHRGPPHCAGVDGRLRLRGEAAAPHPRPRPPPAPHLPHPLGLEPPQRSVLGGEAKSPLFVSRPVPPPGQIDAKL